LKLFASAVFFNKRKKAVKEKINILNKIDSDPVCKIIEWKNVKYINDKRDFCTDNN
jgi:hypothetical protein